MASKQPKATETIKAGNTFLSAFPRYIRMDISCKIWRDEAPHELIHDLKNTIERLCVDLVQEAPVEAVLFPSLFVVSASDAETSRAARQDRGCYLVGLKQAISEPSEQATTTTTTTAHQYSEDEVRLLAWEKIRTWPAEIRETALFSDYEPAPRMSLYFVKREELGLLRPDEWMDPEALSDSQIFQFSKEQGKLAVEAASFLPTTSAASEASAAAVPHSPKKFVSIDQILNRLKWDATFDSKDYVAVYEDRHDGMMEVDVEKWCAESTEEHFIPMHRIRSVKRNTTGQTVWHRAERIDLISGSGA
jgi:uncharacterized protein (UPF0248 family)